MFSSDLIEVKRDCPAALIPSGENITLKKGELVRITQALGGKYSLYVNGNLVQINGEDADAIGKEPVSVEPENQRKDLGVPVDESAVWDQLRTCYDPEIPVDIVELGLIYDCRFTSHGKEGTLVEIKMTLTAPGCGMGGFIAEEVRNKVRSIPGVMDVKVELVWEPLWNRSMMSDAARLKLGMY